VTDQKSQRKGNSNQSGHKANAKRPDPKPNPADPNDPFSATTLKYVVWFDKVIGDPPTEYPQFGVAGQTN
jgi:hypothetical protein